MIQNLGTAWGSVRSKCIRYTGTRMYKYMKLTTGVIPISQLLLATGVVLRKAAIDRGVQLATGRYGCRYRGVLT